MTWAKLKWSADVLVSDRQLCAKVSFPKEYYDRWLVVYLNLQYDLASSQFLKYGAWMRKLDSKYSSIQSK